MQRNHQELLYRSQINKAIRYILANLNQDIQLEDISKEAGFSPFHFHRIFSAFVGETPGGYIRRIRIERSVHYLQQSDRSITEIAFQMGFESHSAYTKAFHQYYRSSPSEIRRQKHLPNPKTYTQTHSEKRREMIQPRIVELEDRRVMYVEAKGLIDNQFNQAADRAFNVVCGYLTRNHKWNQVGECLGICPDDPVSTPPEECTYLGGFILKPGADIQENREIQIMVLKGGNYAVFRHTGPYETLWQTWNAIYRDWLPSSGLKLRDELPYEVYLDDKHKVSPEKLRTDIYIAIE